MKALRWGDNDKYWGPFTYASGDYDRLAIMLGSGDDEYPHCRIRFSAFRQTLIVRLPAIIKPAKEWVDTSKYDWNKDKEGPQGYWDIHEREYGFSYSEKALHVHYGEQTHCWPGSKSKVFFLPWLNWRHVRTSCYGLEGEHYYTEPKKYRFGTPEGEQVWEIRKSCPTVSFSFFDYDGEQIAAKTRIDEREWKFGEGYFKWLSWFRKPMIRRSLDLDFSKEVGPKKGSWKGGTTGHSIGMLQDELHEAAFKRYCEKHNLSFVGIIA